MVKWEELYNKIKNMTSTTTMTLKGEKMVSGSSLSIASPAGQKMIAGMLTTDKTSNPANMQVMQTMLAIQETMLKMQETMSKNHIKLKTEMGEMKDNIQKSD
uniref:Uncharacterized protein n=1 Tax=Micrurus lemniscatus lemniscatus TaxID=129467 RepID=A0A2D4HJH0_MICLE